MPYDEDGEWYEEEISEPINAELINEIRTKLSSILGQDEKKTNILLKRFCDKITNRMMDKMKAYVSGIVAQLFDKWLDEKASTFIETEFTKALEETVIVPEHEGYIQKKCQEVVMSRVKQFFSDNYKSSDRRKNIVNESIDGIIAKVVQQKVSIAINELKDETITKFRKEAMKRMMSGMAKEIASDKKLLSLMTE